MNDIIYKIHELFVEEARKSPLLFNDLASMENYISESYAGRAVIELLQNADDAKANRILFKKVSETICIVANDGRFFSDDDLLALCRSGSSTKTRNSETIGYRGIGFKSVVNFAQVVHLVSGNVSTTFSRKLTKAELNNADKVPLIRIPHEFDGQGYIGEIDKLLLDGYNTIFVFEVKSDMFSKELEEFSDDSLIFLNNLKKVSIISESNRAYDISRSGLSDNERIITIFGDDKSENKSWLVFENEEKTGRTSVAFKYDGVKVYNAELDESVIHSFLPTNDKLSMRIKINGDYSTDPSRTRVVQDNETIVAIKKSAELIAGMVERVLRERNDRYGIIDVIKTAAVDPLFKIKGANPNDLIVMSLIEEVQRVISKLATGKKVFLQPAGITNDDFNLILKNIDAVGIGNESEENVTGLIEFMKAMGIEELLIEDCLKVMEKIECSDITRSTVIAKVIKETKLAMSEEQKKLISKAKLFRFEDGVKSVDESEGSIVEDVFEGIVTDKITTNADYTFFAKRIGLQENQLAINNRTREPEHILTGTETIVQTENFKSKKTIKKWRSVEKNVAAVLELMDDVFSVKDVSEQNIGYDLEAVLNDGSRRYYEVKSVDRLGDMISFSNNEYSTCVAMNKQYYLAIATQTNDEITICFVKNPVESLHFDKRITRWEWICNEYNGEVINTSME